MKVVFSVIGSVLLCTALQAQDVDFGAFGDAPSLLAPSAPAARGAAPAARGAAPAARGAVPAPPPPDRLVRLRDALAKAGSPLTMEQETSLNALLESEIPNMRKTLQTHGQEMLAKHGPVTPPAAATTPAAPPAPAAAPATSAPAAPAPPAAAAARGAAPGNNPNAALLAAALAARGASSSSRVPPEILDALEVEMRQMNDALFTKVASAPALTPAQQTVLTKMSRDQVKSRGGFDALRIAMEDAGSPLTADQIPQVQALFEDQKKARAELAKQSEGTPDPAKLKQLDTDTLTKVVGLLQRSQQTALLGFLRAQQQK